MTKTNVIIRKAIRCPDCGNKNKKKLKHNGTQRIAEIVVRYFKCLVCKETFKVIEE